MAMEGHEMNTTENTAVETVAAENTETPSLAQEIANEVAAEEASVPVVTPVVEAVAEEQKIAPTVTVKRSRKKKSVAAAPTEIAAVTVEEAKPTDVPPSVEAAPATETPAPAQATEAAPVAEVLPPVEPYTLFGHQPNGGPGSDNLAAIPVEVGPDNRSEIIAAISHLLHTAKILAAPVEGIEPSINPRAFHAQIRTFRPAGKFGRVTPMDEKMYAARAAHRLLNKVVGKRVPLNGNYSSDAKVNERIDALIEALAAVPVPA